MSKRNKVKIYSLILVNHGKQQELICSKKTEKEIYEEFKKELEKNKNILFPIRYNNLQHVMVPAEHELVIIKCKQDGDKDKNKIRDNTGTFVNYETDNEDWIVIDRANYDIEETFWVYGFHPRLQRKDFKWIFENFIEKDVSNKYCFKRVVVYLNKLLVDIDGSLEMVMCKNKSDCIRLYNKLEEFAIKKKYKNVLFMGDIGKSKYRKEWIDKIKNLTNWDITKIWRSSTRP